MIRLFSLIAAATAVITSATMANAGFWRSRCNDYCARPIATCCTPPPANCVAPAAPTAVPPAYDEAPPIPPQAQSNRQTYRSYSYDPAQSGAARAPVYQSAPAMRPQLHNARPFRADRKFLGNY